MNTKNDTYELELLVMDTFAHVLITGSVFLSSEEYAHIEKLSLEWDNPWRNDEDQLVKDINECACDIGNSTGINVGEWELEGWRLKGPSRTT